MSNATEIKPTEIKPTEPQKNQPVEDKPTVNYLRYPNGCPIEGHGAYGCVCTPPRPRRY